VNYVSGSSQTVQSMTLPLRAIPPRARVLFIDDFLRGGGTARGVYNLMREFQADVVGVGVLIETPAPRERLIDRYISLIQFQGISPDGEVLIAPSRAVLETAPR
jgi:purine operon repressor